MSDEAGRRERKKQARRRRIYEAARRLFLEQGYAATGVQQIAEAADVAETTFFNHFHSKADLLREMTGEVSGHLEAMLERELATPGRAETRIRHFASEAALALGETEGLARDVLLEMLRTASGPGHALPYLSRVHEPFTRILREGQRRGEVRRDLPPGLLTEIVVGVLNAALVGWLDDPAYPFAERLERFAVLIGELIRPRAAAARATASAARRVAWKRTG